MVGAGCSCVAGTKPVAQLTSASGASILPLVETAYPRQSLGRVFDRARQRWGIPQARLAALLGVSVVVLAELALCPLPLEDAAAFGVRLDALGRAYGVPRWRLDFVCRAAALDHLRLRD